jgi:1,4-alpha-glucan branching enzyme
VKEEGLMIKKSTGKSGKKVTFQTTAQPGSAVYVAGTFNNWDARAARLQENAASGKYSIILSLPSGRYEYKFVVNGDWRTDASCPETARNAYGSLNSVIVV